MLSVRNAVIAALCVFSMSLVFGAVSLLGDPDSGGQAADSFGTRRDGHRAVFELLNSLDVPTTRRVEPPSADLPESSTLVIWNPHADLVTNEPSYLEKMLSWIERGGRLVVAVQPGSRDWMAEARRASQRSRDPDKKIVDIWSVLKLPGIRTETVSAVEEDPVFNRAGPTTSDAERRERIRRAIEESMGMKKEELTSVQLDASGTLEKLKDRSKQVQLPRDEAGGLLLEADAGDSGRIMAIRNDGSRWILAAAFQRGQGEIVIVGEPHLISNVDIAIADNGVLAFDLLTSSKNSVIFDEFYHGLSIRGNPLFLLTKSGYAMATIAILGLLSLQLWRRGVLLGPPLITVAKSRRTIIEYIEAMARFFNRGRAGRSFLLSEIRAGVLRVLGEQLGLTHAKHDVNSIASKLARRSQAEADQFVSAMQGLDAALADGASLSEMDAIRVMQRVTRCL